MNTYAELHAHSAYSFLDGASLPSELVDRACELGLGALAITDHDGLPGVVQLASAARSRGLPTVIGSEISLAGDRVVPEASAWQESRKNQGPATAERERTAAPLRDGEIDPRAIHLLVLARDAEGYRRLSRAIGEGMLASGEKGRAAYNLEELAECGRGFWQVLTGCRKGHVRRALESNPSVWAVDAAGRELDRLITLFGKDSVAVEITDQGQPLDAERNEVLAELARKYHVDLVATTNAHAARPQDGPIADVLAATRAHTSLDAIMPWLPSRGAYLKSDAQMRQIHRHHLHAVDTAGRIGAECSFDLSLVAPKLPPYPVPPRHTEASWLRHLTREAAARRYGPPSSTTTQAWTQINYELDIITQLGFSGYFLIVHEIVDFCRQSDIWCQGRGSAANSAVCYALGITAVDAVRHKMLFERFLSPGRSGPPDIDIDIEADRREEVIQHVYQRYGRRHAAQVANVITYRPRSAIRDAARALGYDSGQADNWAKTVESKIHRPVRVPGQDAVHSDESGSLYQWELSGDIPENVVEIAAGLQHLPRHLGIHSGGMVICDGPVIDVCPVSWARMENRTVLQWDKDDCAEAGLVKFDLLGLGMLSALRIAFTELAERGIVGANGEMLGLHNIGQDDVRVYDLLCVADTIGVFQVESRAQMATLPRLRPRKFYDIVIEVALIRPGPIQGNSVNPYINRRRGREEVTYPHPLLESALEKTLGVPLFQEQLMQIAIDAAGFTPAQADQLRKAMGSKRSHERMVSLKADLLAGMARNGITEDTAEQIYDKLHAFADFGFPESHSFSFAYLVYASAWLKVHYPENFYAGILGAQPMGFYSSQTLVADARRHGVQILPIDVCYSKKNSSVEATEERDIPDPHPLVNVDRCRGLRLGLSNVKGLKSAVDRILKAREEKGFDSIADLARRAELSVRELEALSTAGALRSLGADRREGIWSAESFAFNTLRSGGWFQPTLPGTEIGTRVPDLPTMTAAEETAADLRSSGISSAAHPMEFLRPRLEADGVHTISSVVAAEVGVRLCVGGIVTHRQRPHTAHGVTFISLEDETGLLNIVCSPGLWSRYRPVVRHSQGLIVRGMIERADGVVNFVADGFEPMSLTVNLPSRDFR